MVARNDCIQEKSFSPPGFFWQTTWDSRANVGRRQRMNDFIFQSWPDHSFERNRRHRPFDTFHWTSKVDWQLIQKDD
jgi:hypothetical protein